MSTYTITAYAVTWHPTLDETPTAAHQTELVLYAEAGTTGFTYEIIEYPDWTYEASDFRDIDVTTNIYGFELDGTYYPETSSGTDWEVSFGRIVWSGGTTYVMTFWQEDANQDFIVPIAGAALPTMTTLADFEDFMAEVNFDQTGGVTSGVYGPGSFISFAGAPGVVVGPTVIPEDPDMVLTGTTGDDTLEGGSGDDQINPISNDYGEDVVIGSAGNDTITLSDTTPETWVRLDYTQFDGVTFNVDGTANTATVDKGADGTDTIVDIATPLDWNSWGIGLFGSPGDDTFNIMMGAEQWVDIRGGAGDNTYNFDIESLLRLSFHWDGLNGPISGIVADIGAGTISNNGYGGSDTITVTGSGQFQLRGTDYADDITGSDSIDEAFILRGGNDTVDGAGGIDEVRYDRTGYDSGVTADLADGSVTGTWYGAGFTDELMNIEHLRGSGYNDELAGDDGDNRLRGRDGDDTLISVAGNDTLQGESGSDTYIVHLMGSGEVTINDTSGFDTLVLVGPDSDEHGGSVTYDNGTYTFTLDGGRSVHLVEEYGYTSVQNITLTDESGNFTSDFQLVSNSADIYQSNAFIVGSDGMDAFYLYDYANTGDAIVWANAGDDYVVLADTYGASVYAGDDNDTVIGGDSDDWIEGGDGDDSLTGGAGDDWIDGGAGADFIDGGDGYDIVSYESATRSVRVDLQNPAFMYNDAVGDTFANVEAFQTGGTVDQLRGDSGANEFYTGGLSDRLYGRAGDDFLFGEAGADAFYGGTGADTMTGGDDADRRDRYIYFNIVESGVGDGNRDVITDFVSGEDRIEIRRFDADATSGGKQYFDFVGDAGLSGTAGELAYVQAGGNTIIQADVDGDGVADFEIELTGIMDLTAGDFLI